jgi:hypothetical protein
LYGEEPEVTIDWPMNDSGRKLRLAAVAAIRRLLPGQLDVLTDAVAVDVLADAVTIAERFADGQATEDETARAGERVRALAVELDQESMDSYEPGLGPDEEPELWAARATDSLMILQLDQGTVNRLLEEARCATGKLDAQSTEEAAQRSILREIFGNPARPPRVMPHWLTWNNGTALKLAQAIYDERAFDQLPILADALEDAGCGDADLLAHLRGPGPHLPGCWALDAVLRRE